MTCSLPWKSNFHVIAKQNLPLGVNFLLLKSYGTTRTIIYLAIKIFSRPSIYVSNRSKEIEIDERIMRIKVSIEIKIMHMNAHDISYLASNIQKG